ncbi:MAG: alpha/beta hydrolase [Pseudomonadota bacterium]|nr:alpha/beta hydrolase [Pseudomonadota bacterium]
MKKLRYFGVVATAIGVFSFSHTAALAQDMSHGADNFYQSTKLTSKKVSFKNQYQMNVVGNLFMPKDFDPNQKYAGIIVGHPMGAVKEQSSNLYAQKLAEKGFITLAIDLSFWGESAGEPRNTVAPEIYSEDFSAAVDFLGTRNFIDRDKIGVLGICGSGSFAISAAKIDPRIKAIATVSMYDMGNASRYGLNKTQTLDQRKAMQAAAADQRYKVFEGENNKYVGGTTLELTADTPAVQKEFYDFYRTPRGEFTPENADRSQTTKPTLSSVSKFNNFYPFMDIETIAPRPMLFITGDAAHSKEFSEDAYKRAGEPKELFYVEDAGHVDLYDRTGLIPFQKLDNFFRTSLE